MTEKEVVKYYTDKGLEHTCTWHNPDGSLKIKFRDPSKNDKTFRQAYPSGKDENDYTFKKPAGWIDSLYINGKYHKDDSGHIVLDTDTVVLVEGEKDADTVATKFRIQAVTGAGGGGTWKKEYTSQLTGKCIIVLSDNDETGSKYERNAINALYDKADVFVIRVKDMWPDAQEHNDITDMYDALGQDETKKRLKDAIDNLEKDKDKITEPIPDPGKADAIPTECNCNLPLDLKYGVYTVDNYGVSVPRQRKDENDEIVTVDDMIMSAPVLITKTYSDVETHEEKKEVWCRKIINNAPYENTVVVENEVIRNTRRVTELAKYGYPISSVRARDIVNYFCYIDDMNIDVIPIEKSISHMGRFDGNAEHFVPYVNDVHIDKYGDFPDMREAIQPVGDFDKWLSMIRECVAVNPETKETVSHMVQMSLAASFASPLVGMIKALNYFVDFWGKTGCGKTVAAMVGASVWGNPKEGEGYTLRFDGTRTSFEAAANFLRNIPMVLDESQLIAKKRDGSLSWDPVYYLAEGASKSRSNVNLGLRKAGKWELVIISTGEQPLADSESDGGKKNRIIEVECFEKDKAGNFSFLKEHGDKVCDVINENYGTAGPMWIELISKPEVFEEIKTIYETTKEVLTSSHVSTKQAISGALLLAAYNTADKYIIKSGNPMTVPDIIPHLMTDDDVDTYADYYARFISYLAAHNCEIVNKKDGEGYGPSDRPIIGVRKQGPDNDRDYLDVPYDTFCDICNRTGGKSVDSFIKWLNENEKAMPPNDRHMIGRQRINGQLCKCVRLIVEACDSVSDYGPDDNILDFPG